MVHVCNSKLRGESEKKYVYKSDALRFVSLSPLEILNKANIYLKIHTSTCI